MEYSFSLPITGETVTFSEASVESLNIAKAIAKVCKENYCAPEYWDPHTVTFEEDATLRDVALAAQQVHCELLSQGRLSNKTYQAELSARLAMLLTDRLDDYYPYDDAGQQIMDSLKGLPEAQHEGVHNALVDELANIDTSKPKDVITGVIEFFYTLDVDLVNEGAEDTDNRVEISGHKWVNLNGLRTLLKMANISSQEYLDYLYEEYDENPCIQFLEDNPVHCNPLRPANASAKDLDEIMENATYGGIAAITSFIDIQDIISRDVEKPIVVRKGVIGIEDVIWGSGCNTTLPEGAGVVIEPHDTNWTCLPKHSERDNVYGFCRGMLRSKLAPWTKLDEAKLVWNKFTRVFVTNENAIDSPFMSFRRGTPVTTVKRWIETHYECNIQQDLIQH